jgi:hypothetical protein
MFRADDIDQDGIRDVLIGARSWNGGQGVVIARSIPDGAELWRREGPTWVNTGFGESIAMVSDHDGDGIEDVIVSAKQEFFAGGSGVVYLLSGATGQVLRTTEGQPGDSFFGTFLATIGDHDSDGFLDFAVGIPSASRLVGGGVAVLSGIDGSELFTFQSFSVSAGVGFAAGDVDGDGLSEICHGGGDGSYLHSGLDGSVIHFHPTPRDNTAYHRDNANAALGDLNFDGIPDYAVGAPGELIRDSVGHVYVYDGATGEIMLELAGTQLDSRFGRSIAAVGDVDGDGYPDIAVGVPDQRHGHLPFGPGSVRIFSSRDGVMLHEFKGRTLRDRAVGTSILGLGDLDGNGFPGFLIGSSGSVNVGISNGAWRTYGIDSYLDITPMEISASVGGTLTFDLDFPDEEGGRDYLILASGDVPGRTPFFSVTLPLARTPLLDYTARNAPLAVFPGARGTLDAFGDATATATFAPGQAAAWAGRSVRFSAVTLAAPGDAGNYSAGMRVSILP